MLDFPVFHCSSLYRKPVFNRLIDSFRYISGTVVDSRPGAYGGHLARTVPRQDRQYDGECFTTQAASNVPKLVIGLVFQSNSVDLMSHTTCVQERCMTSLLSVRVVGSMQPGSS